MRLLMTTLSILSALLLGCGTRAPDVEGAKKAQAALTVAVGEHRTRSAATTAKADCEAELTRYRAEANPLVEQLRSLSGDFDWCMHQMSRAGDADFATMCGALRSELDTHADGACTGSVDVMHTEATRHCDEMDRWAGSVLTRTNGVGTMMGPGRACTP